MRNTKPVLLAACLATLVPAAPAAAASSVQPATGQPPGTGPYVAAGVGFITVRDSEITDSTVPGVTAVMSADRGLALSLALGYDLGRTRVEAELGYQKSDLDTLDFGIASFALSGDVSSLSLMCNGYYDFDTGGPASPFLTAGVGLAKVDIGDFSVPATGLPPVSDDDTVAAYQFGGGVAFQVNERMTLDLAYRYFATADLNFATTQAEYKVHRFTAGLRLAF